VSTAIGTRAVLETWSCSCDRLSHCAKHASASPGKGDPVAWCRGRIDHFCADVRGQRLFIAALENRTVEVLDIRKGERSTEIKGLSEPQGVFYSSQNDELYVASGGDGTLRIYDGTTLKLRQTLEFGADADDVRYGAHSEDAAAKGVRRSDLERFGDVAESLVVAALVKSGLPLRKAKALASTVRAEADQVSCLVTELRQRRSQRTNAVFCP
jgi:hypothetical protein